MFVRFRFLFLIALLVAALSPIAASADVVVADAGFDLTSSDPSNGGGASSPTEWNGEVDWSATGGRPNPEDGDALNALKPGDVITMSVDFDEGDGIGGVEVVDKDDLNLIPGAPADPGCTIAGAATNVPNGGVLQAYRDISNTYTCTVDNVAAGTPGPTFTVSAADYEFNYLYNFDLCVLGGAIGLGCHNQGQYNGAVEDDCNGVAELCYIRTDMDLSPLASLNETYYVFSEPLAVDDEETQQANQVIEYDVLANDLEGANVDLGGIDWDLDTLGIVTQPTCGIATVVNGKIVFDGEDADDPTNDCVNGDVANIEYTITNEMGCETTAVLSIVITNTAPDAVDDIVDGDPYEPVTFAPKANDVDADDNLNDLSLPDSEDFVITEFDAVSAEGGTVEWDEEAMEFTYTPPADPICGDEADSFTYTLSDQNGDTDTATVTIDIPCPELTATKSADVSEVTVGEDIEFTITVENTSDEDVDLQNIEVVDPEVADCSGTDDGPLAPGDSVEFTCTYTATADDIPTFTNTATVTADLIDTPVELEVEVTVNEDPGATTTGGSTTGGSTTGGTTTGGVSDTGSSQQQQQQQQQGGPITINNNNNNVFGDGSGVPGSHYPRPPASKPGTAGDNTTGRSTTGSGTTGGSGTGGTTGSGTSTGGTTTGRITSGSTTGTSSTPSTTRTTNPPQTTATRTVAFTGSTTEYLLGAGGLMLLAGAVLLRRRPTQS